MFIFWTVAGTIFRLTEHPTFAHILSSDIQMSGLLLSHNPGFGIHSFKLGLLYKEASIRYKRKKGDNEMQSSLASAENWFQDPKTCRRSNPLYTVMWCVCIGYSRVCLHITSFTSFEWNQCYCLAHGKFKVCFLELSGIFFPQIFSISGWLNPRIQNPWIWRVDYL